MRDTKNIYTNNRQEFFNLKMKRILAHRVTVHVLSPSDNPKSKGFVDSMNKIIIAVMRFSHRPASLDDHLWSETPTSAIHIINIIFQRVLRKKTTFYSSITEETLYRCFAYLDTTL